jgi:hypothetical protein
MGINHSYAFGQSGGGVSFVDFNGDGLDDLTFGTAVGQLIHFYRNTGNGFVRIAPLIGNNSEQKQILWADFDNDGDQDLFVCAKGNVNRLYQNMGNLVLKDITELAGLPLDSLDTFNACWADFNRDGWLDLYVCERVPLNRPLNRNFLFFNNADGTFTDVSETSNTLVDGNAPFSSSAHDYNNDKWPDIYIANDRNRGNVMLHNEGKGIFSDYSVLTGTGLEMDGMSVALGDYNNDNYTDIYVSNTEAGNVLFANQGSFGLNFFENVAENVGVLFGGTAWGANFLDGDCDGDLDLYVSGSFSSDGPSAAFYEQITVDSFALASQGFEGDTVNSFANATGDFNNDGYQDIAVVNLGTDKSFLFQNQSGGNHYIKIKLNGVLSNKDGVGAKIQLYVDSSFQSYYTHSGIGFLGQNSHVIHFGTNDRSLIDSIKVLWPTGHIDIVRNTFSNQTLVINEGESTEGIIHIDDDVEIIEGDFPSSTTSLDAKHLRAFPNPNDGRLTIVHDKPIRKVKLFDSMGKEIVFDCTQVSTTESYLSLRGFLPGIYYLFIENSDGYTSMTKIMMTN